MYSGTQIIRICIFIAFFIFTHSFQSCLLKPSRPSFHQSFNPPLLWKQSKILTNTRTGLRRNRLKPLNDFLGLGIPEIALIAVAALVLFGPETLKSLSKDVGRAAAELKEIPKTFKEGMEEGQQEAQITKLKAMAAEKRKKREEKEKSKDNDDDRSDEEITDN